MSLFIIQAIQKFKQAAGDALSNRSKIAIT